MLLIHSCTAYGRDVRREKTRRADTSHAYANHRVGFLSIGKGHEAEAVEDPPIHTMRDTRREREREREKRPAGAEAVVVFFREVAKPGRENTGFGGAGAVP